MGGSRALAVAGIASASAGFALIALAISGRGDGLKREVSTCLAFGRT